MRTAESIDDLPDLNFTLSMSGLEFMQAMLRGDVCRPPISALLNYRLESVERGRVVFRGKPSFPQSNPARGVHGGWYGTILDSCMSCAVMTTLPKGRVYTTLEYKVNMIGAIPLDTEVFAIGQIDHAGRTTGVAHGEIRGTADNRLYATGSTTCLIMEPGTR
jgi:uncharacterized protein (TIGR00369 family)